MNSDSDLIKGGISGPWVAVAGNPNCGKTTLFNRLTGSRYKVANYPGVTVECKSGLLPIRAQSTEQKFLQVVDLPGTYSLSGTSTDEQIAIRALTGANPPSAVIAVVDSTNLTRNLFLVSQLIDLRLPLIVALNMSDEAEKAGINIYREILARQLNVAVVKIVAYRGQGLDELTRAVELLLSSPTVSVNAFAWAADKHTASGIPPLLSTPSIPDYPANGLYAPDPHEEEASLRYSWISEIVAKSCGKSSATEPNRTDRLDSFLTHKLWGPVTLFFVLGFVFQIVFAWSRMPMDLIAYGFEAVGAWLSGIITAGPLRNLLVDGVLAGVSSLIVFVPQIALLFLCIGLLEDSGYLCRAAFVLDRFMRRFGLQGRSFIPLLSCFACNVPGIMATRIIPSKRERLTTIMISPFMSCSARLPVYSVMIGAFIPRTPTSGFLSLQGVVLLGLYLLGIVGAIVSAILFDRLHRNRESAPFVMEMAPFRTPSLRVVLRGVLDRILVFIKSTGTVIVLSSVIVWFAATYPRPTETGQDLRHTYAGQIGAFIEPAIRPLGFNWEIGVGILSSFAAREVFVSTLATVYSVQSDEPSTSLARSLEEKRRAGLFTLPTALSLLIFYVFACQCLPTLAVCRRETGAWRFPVLMFGYMTLIAYCMSFITYQTAVLFLN